MRYGEIKKCDIANGEGVRVSLFVSGCTHHCKGCFNEATWDFDYGKEFTQETEEEILKALEPEYVNGLSVLGGEPFEPQNQRVLVPFLKKVKERYPGKTIWCYTGYLFDRELCKKSRARCEVTDEMLALLDVLVDGRFVEEKKNIMLVAAEDNTTIKRAAGFTESMFTVNGGNLQMAGGSVTASDGNAIGSGSLTVEGTGDGVTGSIVEVVSGNYALIDGTTLTGNTTTGNGGAINNAAGANVYLLGGTITANSAAAGGAIYSEGTVNIRGTVSVTGNTVTNSFEAASNLVLAKDGVINVSGAVTGSAIGVAVQEANAGRTVVKLGDAVTDVKLADVLSQITYEGDSSLKIGEDGTLVSTTEPSPTPTPAEEKLKVTGKECKWSGSGTVKIKFQSNVKGTYYIDWVKRGEKAPTIDTSRVGAPIEADTNVTAKVTDLPDYDVDIYVCVISDKDKSNYGSVMFQPDSKERPVTPTPSHTPVVPDVKESVVQGFEKALVFYPNTFYDFKVIGAGTQNNNPGEGDVRWVPVGWSMSSNPSTWNTSWKIGAKSGIYTDAEKAYTIYIKYAKQVYSGNDWQETDASEVLPYQFKAAPLTQATTTPGANGTNGDGTGSGDGTTDGGTTDVTPTTYADGTNGTAKSAVSTGDESPIGTMLALAAASVLAGGYVLIRRRKKEM